MRRSVLHYVSDVWLHRQRARFDSMPDWAFWVSALREMRFAVESEILARELPRIARRVGGYVGTWCQETWN